MLLLTGVNLGRGARGLWFLWHESLKEEKEVIVSTCDAMAYRWKPRCHFCLQSLTVTSVAWLWGSSSLIYELQFVPLGPTEHDLSSSPTPHKGREKKSHCFPYMEARGLQWWFIKPPNFCAYPKRSLVLTNGKGHLRSSPTSSQPVRCKRKPLFLVQNLKFGIIIVTTCSLALHSSVSALTPELISGSWKS